MKTPDEVILIANDWRTPLADGDTVVSSTWDSEPTGLTLLAPSIDVTGFYTYSRVAGGTLGADYLISNHVVTADGLEYDEVVHLPVRSAAQRAGFEV
jgi:hypothetical protein